MSGKEPSCCANAPAAPGVVSAALPDPERFSIDPPSSALLSGVPASTAMGGAPGSAPGDSPEMATLVAEHTLEYGRGQRRRGVPWRHLVVAAILAGCVAGSWYAGRSARDHAQSQLYVRQAARHVEPADTVVYASTSPLAEQLIDAGTHVPLSRDAAVPAGRIDPRSFRVLAEAIGPRSLEAVGTLVFLHEMNTPSGLRRIVAVRFLPEVLDGRVMPHSGLIAHVFEPGGLLSRPSYLGDSFARMAIPTTESPPLPPETSHGPMTADDWDALLTGRPGARAGMPGILSRADDPFVPAGIRWFAGQPDRQDPSHFTIEYELNGVRGTIDGYLTDDGRHVRMSVRPLTPPTTLQDVFMPARHVVN